MTEREFDEKAKGSAGSTEEEEIIELTEEVTAALPGDDDIIELVDEVVVGDAADPAAEADLGARPDQVRAAPAEMDVKAGEVSARFPGGDIKIADEIEDDLDEEDEEDDFVNSLGMDLETHTPIDRILEDSFPPPAPPMSTEQLAAQVSSEQIEAAVERVILRILPDKIDGILREAIEQTLTREIDKIKEILLADAGGKA